MPRAPDLSGRVLDDRYELIEPIGEGTFGRVYRGLDRRLARPVAVKVIKPWWAEDPVWVERFEREAQTLARVSDPGIVQIFDVGQAGECLYYVAELVDGESLADRLRRGPLPPAEAADVAEQLCRALARAHARQVVHRDVKPANILLGRDGRVKVGDFGVARLAEGTSQPGGTTAIGTPRYMSPEQARGERTTPASDVYAVGVVLYEMLAGRPPFPGDSAVEVAVRHLSDPPPPLPPSVPGELAEIVERALAKEPGARFADGAAMAIALEATPRDALEAAPAGGGGDTAVTSAAPLGTAATSVAGTAVAEEPRTAVARTAVAPPLPPRTTTRSRRGPGRLLLVGVVLAGAVVALVGLLAHGPGSTTVPDLHGLRRTGAEVRARRNHLRVQFSSRYAHATKGTAVEQHPGAGKRVRRDSSVQVVLSDGPRPVDVPAVVGRDASEAERILADAGLRWRATAVAAPGEQPGTVTRQSPSASATAPQGATVALSVAEAPRWRTVTSFASSGAGDGTSVPFRIRGERWRLQYAMAYDGGCSLLLFCFGPNAEVSDVRAGARVDAFDLSKGSGKTHMLATGAGIYQVKVSAGSDAAHWSMTVQDYY
jgi:serine/threonine-protein kinase